MNITVTKESEVCTLTISGRVDTITAPELEKAVTENAGDCTKMVFEMSGVDYISSAGIRVLVFAHKTMKAKEGLAIRGVNDNVLSIIKMTGLEKKLTIEE